MTGLVLGAHTDSMRRRLLLLWSVVLALLVLWGWLLLRPKPKPLGVPTRTSFERVQEGTTKEDVEAILGSTGLHRDPYFSDDDHGPIDRLQWVEQEAVFTIYLKADGRAGSKHYRAIGPPPESFCDRLRRWLSWCERAFGSS